MSDKTINEVIEELSQAVALVEPSKTKGLEDVRARLLVVKNWARRASASRVVGAMSAAIERVDQVLEGEAPDAGASLAVVRRAVSAIRSAVREGRRADEAAFPRAPALVGPDGGTQGRAASSRPGGSPDQAEEGPLADFLARQAGVAEDMEALILGLDKVEDEEKLAELRRLIQTLKGESALLGLGEVERICHQTEEMLAQRRIGDMVDALFAVKDWLGRAFASYSGEGPEPEPLDALLLRLAEPGSGGAARPEPPDPMAATASKAGVANGDAELLGDFVVEAREHLEAADLHLLTLETEPANEEALNAVFRAFHTIKGVAGFLELNEVCRLAHESEGLLDRARRGETKLAGGVIDAVFDAVDMLRKLVANLDRALRSGDRPAEEASVPILLERLKSIASGGDLPAEGLGEDEPLAGKKLGEILVARGVVTERDISEALARQKEPMAPRRLGRILVDSGAADESDIEAALKAQEEGRRLKLGGLLVEGGRTSSESVDAALEKQSEEPRRSSRLGEILVREGKASAKEVALALRAQRAQSEGGPGVAVREPVKVDAERLDRLVDLIGELVIAESVLSGSAEVGNGASPELTRCLGEIDRITRELRKTAMALRMVPVRAAFQKMARLVRDLARKTGKKVELFMSGEDTELDKSVVDLIGDPLMHMVRNAVDHGLEDSTEERRAAGKPEGGRVELRAFHKGGAIYIEVEDDGRGLDTEAILAKARERGLIGAEEVLGERDIHKLIFDPGFTTAKEVTEVSGRGVGLDVVRRNVTALRGRVDVRSERGKGTCFSLCIPLTLAVMDGTVVRVGVQRYVLPSLSIVMSLRPRPWEISPALEGRETLCVQGRLIPLIRLHRLFDVSGAEEDLGRALAVVVEDEGRHVGLLVDEVLGQQQIVIKSVGESMKNAPGLGAGAVMPDGRVSLILDPRDVVQRAAGREAFARTGAAGAGPAGERGELREAPVAQASFGPSFAGG